MKGFCVHIGPPWPYHTPCGDDSFVTVVTDRQYSESQSLRYFEFIPRVFEVERPRVSTLHRPFKFRPPWSMTSVPSPFHAMNTPIERLARRPTPSRLVFGRCLFCLRILVLSPISNTVIMFIIFSSSVLVPIPVWLVYSHADVT